MKPKVGIIEKGNVGSALETLAYLNMLAFVQKTGPRIGFKLAH